jgi:hypothetical protein
MGAGLEGLDHHKKNPAMAIFSRFHTMPFIKASSYEPVLT